MHENSLCTINRLKIFIDFELFQLRGAENCFEKMRPIYNAPKDAKDKKDAKPASSFMPLHMQHCLKMSSQIWNLQIKMYSTIKTKSNKNIFLGKWQAQKFERKF